MLILLFGWTAITILCFTAGVYARLALRWMFGETGEPARAGICTCFLGFIAIGLILSIASLGIRMAWEIDAGLIVACILLAASAPGPLKRALQEVREAWALSPWGLLMMEAAGIGSVLWFAALTPHGFDSGTYHVPAIRWAEEYPTVPGLANLGRNLGFQSTWTLCSAAFGIREGGGPPFHVLNGLFLAWFLILCAPGFHRLIKGGHDAGSWMSFLALSVVFFRFLTSISSPSPEAPAGLLYLGALLAAAGAFHRPANDSAILVVVALFAPTVKMNVVGALAFIPIVLLGGPFSRRRATAATLLLSLLVFLPWLARNYVVSGFPLYPSVLLDIGHPDWKAPRSAVDELGQFIREWARVHDSSGPASSSLADWVPRWFLVLSPVGKVYMTGVAVLPVLVFLARFVRPTRAYFLREKSGRTMALGCAVYAGITFWFFTAPDTRYGFPMLSGLGVLVAGSLLAGMNRYRPLLGRIGVRIAGVVCGTFLLVNVVNRSEGGSRLRSPGKYPEVELREVRVPGGRVGVPVAGLSLWYAPLPASQSVNEGLEWRGPRLSNGFRIHPGGQ